MVKKTKKELIKEIEELKEKIEHEENCEQFQRELFNKNLDVNSTFDISAVTLKFPNKKEMYEVLTKITKWLIQYQLVE